MFGKETRLPTVAFRPALALMAFGAAAVVWGPAAVDRGLFESLGGKRGMLAAGGMVLALGAIIPLLPAAARAAGRWILLATAILSVLLASDLFTTQGADEIGPASFALRLSLLALAAGGLALGGLVPRWKDLAAGFDWRSYLLVAAQVLALTLLMRSYEVESTLVYHNMMQLVLYGFLLHALLEPRWRLPFFLLLTLGSILCIFRPADGLWLIGTGLALIGMCHLPIGFARRAGLILAAGGLLAALRVGYFKAPWSSTIWPVLGSIFMFRLMVYLYDLRHQKEPASPWMALSYFFMLPNVAFPLFPVVDYATFRRTYYDQAGGAIFRRGAEWMGMGILQLLLYRVVYNYLVIPQESVESPAQLVRFVVFNYALYLRLSGLFHLIAGMLHLFGFNLPLTHHHYFLASGFTDFWRRINIYWKYYMQKIFYFPIYFKLRRLGLTAAMVLSTVLVFAATWFLHAYQYFWLRGEFLLTDVDVLFWAVLGVLVVVNTLWESSRGRERATGAQLWEPRRLFPLALRTIGTFGLLCVLWSMWTASSLGAWLAMWRRAGLPLTGAGLLLPAACVGAFAAGEWLRLRFPARASRLAAAPTGPAFPEWWKQLATAAAVALVWLVGQPGVYRRLPTGAGGVARDLTQARLNAADAARLQRGYYEDLLGVEKFNSALWEVYAKIPPGWKQLHEVLPPSPGFLRLEIPPNVSFTFKRAPFRSNRWGMRDKEYEQAKPAGCYRIALLGSSHVMGSGVGNGESFEHLLEDRLNAERFGGNNLSYEILNFAVDGYSPIEQISVMEQKVPGFAPDAVFFVAHPDDFTRAVNYLATAGVEGRPIPFEPARELAERAGIRKSMSETEARERLSPLCGDLLPATYRRVADDCRRIGATPVWIFLGVMEQREADRSQEELTALAERAGFETLSLADVYANQDPVALRVAEWDWHPNAAGHRLIAEKLYQALRDHRDRLALVTSAHDQANIQDER